MVGSCESERSAEVRDDAMSSFGLVQRLADASRHSFNLSNLGNLAD